MRRKTTQLSDKQKANWSRDWLIYGQWKGFVKAERAAQLAAEVQSPRRPDKAYAASEPRKYIMGGFVLPLKRLCDRVGTGKVRVNDAKGRLVKTFNSRTMADQFVSEQNAKAEPVHVPGELPIVYLREYDGAAEHLARYGELPHLMGSPGALDWIQSDPEAFEQRVREMKYGIAMDKLNLPEGDQ